VKILWTGIPEVVWKTFFRSGFLARLFSTFLFQAWDCFPVSSAFFGSNMGTPPKRVPKMPNVRSALFVKRYFLFVICYHYSATSFVIPVKTGIQDVYAVQNITGYPLSRDLMLEKRKASLEFSVIVFSGRRKKPPKGDLPWVTVPNLILRVNLFTSVSMSIRRAGA
jgi:hypothetical protein